MSQLLLASWFSSNHPLSRLLAPISWLFGAVAYIRRCLYRWGALSTYAAPRPVIVVGNLTVGGAGKTPFVIWLVEELAEAGYRPAVISRGYGGDSDQYPVLVADCNDPRVVGDEPAMIAQRCQCPVVVSPKRIDAIQTLLERTDCDVIVSDDGLQHYAMGRDVEIAIIDSRRFGNGKLLPAGPLREPVKRLKSVDFVVARDEPEAGEFSYTLTNAGFVNVATQQRLAELPGEPKQTVHAVAGIGHPGQFFEQLKTNGLDVIEHPFPDHHHFTADDLRFDDGKPVVMTEKDAVKCRAFATANDWYLKVDADVDPQLVQQIITKIRRKH